MKINMKINSGFRNGSGCFPCEACKKLTRQTPETSGTRLCPKCYKEFSNENLESEVKK